MKFFVGTELGVANFLQRHFDWNANALWYEQIPNARDPHRTRFFLGGKDAIVDATVSCSFSLFKRRSLTSENTASKALPYFSWRPRWNLVRSQWPSWSSSFDWWTRTCRNSALARGKAKLIMTTLRLTRGILRDKKA